MASSIAEELKQLLYGFTVALHCYIDEMHLCLTDINNRVRAMERGRTTRGTPIADVRAPPICALATITRATAIDTPTGTTPTSINVINALAEETSQILREAVRSSLQRKVDDPSSSSTPAFVKTVVSSLVSLPLVPPLC